MPFLYHWLPLADDDVSVTLPPEQNITGPLAPMFGVTGFELTVTVWVLITKLPWISVSVHVIVVVPIGKGSLRDNVALSLRTGTGGVVPQLSVTAGEPTTTVVAPDAHTVMSGVNVRVGFVSSMIITSNEDWLAFPLSSVNVYVTCVVPTGKGWASSDAFTEASEPLKSRFKGVPM